MKKRILFIILGLILFALYGYRSSSKTEENYSGHENLESFQESEKKGTEVGETNIREESQTNAHEETEKKTASIEETTKFHPPTADNP